MLMTAKGLCVKAIERLLPQDGQTIAAIFRAGKYNGAARSRCEHRFPQKLYRRADPMSDESFLDIETKLAYQEDLVESLNKVVSDQQRQIDALEKTCRKMADRLMDLSEAFEATQVEDAPPPHY